MPVGSDVHFTLAAPLQASVPELVGLNLVAAREALTSGAFVVGAITREPSQQPDGTVLRQSPEARTLVERGATIDLFVAGTSILTPNLIGLPRDEARRAANTAGLEFEVAGTRRSTQPVDSVVEQEPPPSQRVLAGTVIRVFLAEAPPVEVPAFIGRQLEDARTLATQIGLLLNVSAQEESDQRQGTVLRQRPEPGQIVIRGATVDVTVAVPQLVVVPSVIRMTPEEARGTLGNARLAIVVAPLRVPSGIEAGLVATQSPAAGVRMAAGSQVTVELSGGRQVIVPKVVGLTQAQAVAQLDAAGLVSKISIRDGERDEVLDQSPEPGARVFAGSTVALTVSTRTVVVPSIINLTIGFARARLTPLGLILEVESLDTDDPRPLPGGGTILSQFPKAGTRVAPGSVVTGVLRRGGRIL